MRLSQAQLARLQSLGANAGGLARLSAQRVVQDAKRKTSPLHSLFDWHVQRAAERYWLDRARAIIGAVTVLVTYEDITIKTPKYVHLPVKGGGYGLVSEVRHDPELAVESLIAALKMAAGNLQRAYEFARPLGLSDQIDRLLLDVASVRRVMESQRAA